MWVGCPFSAEFVRIAEGGAVLDVLPTPGRWAIACAFGGPDPAELWCTTAVTSRADLFRGRSEGFLEVARVEVPGAS